MFKAIELDYGSSLKCDIFCFAQIQALGQHTISNKFIIMSSYPDLRSQDLSKLKTPLSLMALLNFLHFPHEGYPSDPITTAAKQPEMRRTMTSV